MSAVTIMFLELPVCLPGLEENGKQNPDRTVSGKFIPSHIVAYHESYFEERTLIYLSNGQPFMLDCTVEQYEAKIQAFFEIMQKQANRKDLIKKIN